MLILEIALGILLGFLLINNLPALLEIGGWALLGGLTLFGLALVAVIGYFTFTENFALFLILVGIAIIFIVYKLYSIHYAESIELRDLEQFIERKEKLGYNMSKERKNASALRKSSNKEVERRRALGYDE